MELLSVGPNGRAGNAASSGISLNTTGTVAAFFSDASTLVNNDTNAVRDIFVRDRNSMTTERVSISSTGTQANGASAAKSNPPAISDDGNIVAFDSEASNLVLGDENGKADVFVRNRSAGTTELISLASDSTPGNGTSLAPSISADGRFVAFVSSSTNLIADDTNGVQDIFVRDRMNGTTERVCDQTIEPNGPSFSPAISPDGNFVAFASAASNLVSGDTNNHIDVFVCDRSTGTIERVSVSSTGEQGNGDSILPDISNNGVVVAFKSVADNLVPNDTNGVVDVFARDRSKGTTERISVDPHGGNSNDVSFPPSVSDDGRFVAFGSFATNLVLGLTPPDSNEAADIFVRDRQTGTTQMVDVNEQCQQANRGTPDLPPSISGDGTQIGFISFAGNLVAGDINDVADVFVTPNPFLCSNTISCVSGTCRPGFVCLQDAFCELPPPTATPTPQPGTPTRTPTPFSCFFDKDCPLGQVCGADHVCHPAPTPTPTIACTSSSDCPSPEVCVNGICRDLSTPTVTPTPLPTCSTDQDCPSGDHCRAGVCVPIRQCDDSDPNIDRKNCLGVRETCINNTCECGGDCNLDGFVYGNEISQMICVLSGNCDLTECPAGDFNGDGHIDSSEVCQAVTNLGLGCPAEGALFAHDRNEARTLAIGSSTGVQGGTVTIPVNLSGGGDVATAQVDILLDTRVFEIPNPATDCVADPRISATDTSFTFLPQRPDAPRNEMRIRLFVADLDICRHDLNFPPASMDQGILLSCQFHIKPSAPLGTTPLDGERVNIGDPRGNPFVPATASPGSVTIVQQSCTMTSDCPGGLFCLGGVCVPSCTSNDQCAMGTQCINGVCQIPCDTDMNCPSGDVCREGVCEPACSDTMPCTPPDVCLNGGCTEGCTMDSDCPPGILCVDGICRPPCTNDFDCRTGQTCMVPPGVCVPVTPSPTPSSTPNAATPTPTVGSECTVSSDCDARFNAPGRETCVAGQCICTGDCNNNGVTEALEITEAIQIFGSVLSVDQCPAAAQEGNGAGGVSAHDITIAIQNFGLDCPTRVGP